MAAAPARQPTNQWNDFKDYYLSLPRVPRSIITATVVVSVTGLFISPMWLVFHLQSITSKFQLWRLITPFFFGGRSMDTLFNIYFLWNYSSQLNSTLFLAREADYVYFILFVMASLNVMAIFMKPYILTDGLVMAIVYLWSQMNRETTVTFMFGFKFPAIYLPFVLVGWDLFTKGGGFPIVKVMGILAGHLYYFLDKVWPDQNGGRKILVTPQWLVNYFPPTQPSVAGFTPQGFTVTTPVRPGTEPSIRQRGWGRGQRLGE
ncbi:hypothetical protein SmJEL517_g04117 [Synchytrium microbalum]|uniref:Derlin n=1 Tax=Synchytrium microbalum TaxID=1806994 RepID=A0A507C0C5_9FUNG|nr:uncharacterized protein SmJEL517_g04117 [Synchytrium microbalum]TPX32818.1 hypothetical protein SmJEL517_g04117 [Synchytrium microbalum]